MIHWLLQSLDDCPEILRGDAMPAWLSPAERERTFKAEKRRRDWLLGRWTAKNLVQRYLAQTTGATVALDAIFIGADADGAPYAARGEGRGANYEDRLAVSLSISHSHGTAFCGLVETMGLGDYEIKRLEIGDWRLGSDTQSPISNLQSPNLLIPQSLLRPSLGCDLELIEPREGNFLDSFFTAAEVAAVREVRERMVHEAHTAHRMNSAPATESALKRTGAAALTGLSRFPVADADFNRRELAPADILTTAIWSGKEAVLKALREGLRIDTRRITCRFDEFDAPPQDWTPFAVIVDEGLAAQFPGVWSGWWRVEDRFALTMALLQETEL